MLPEFITKMFGRSYLAVLMIGFFSGVIGGYVVYFFKFMSSKPEVRFAPNSNFGQFIVNNCSVLNETFYPTWWAGSSLLQTLVPMVLRSKQDELQYTRESLDCPDGGLISLDWFDRSKDTEDLNKPIAMVFPGLIGDSQSEYLRNIVKSVHDLGYRVVAFNNRGRGGMELKTPRIYCAANFEDIELAIDHVRAKNPSTRIVASGYSMGGMVLTRYLAERGANVKVDAAMLVSANYDLVNGTKNMETGFINRFVARLMTKALVDVLWSEKDVLSKTDKPVQWDKLRSATSFRELDKYFTCPMWGYKDPEDYFRDSTNTERINKIRVPTLALNSGDDVFSPYDTLPLNNLNEFVVFAITKRGGHLGFMDGWIPSIPYYGDRLVEQFHRAMLHSASLKDLFKSNE